MRDRGEIARRQGDFERASGLLSQSLLSFEKMGNDIPIAVTLDRFASLAGSTGRKDKAARLLAAVDAHIGEDFRQSSPLLIGEHERLVTSTREHLGNQVFEQLWAEGAEMSLEQAVAYAIEGIKGNEGSSR